MDVEIFQDSLLFFVTYLTDNLSDSVYNKSMILRVLPEVLERLAVAISVAMEGRVVSIRTCNSGYGFKNRLGFFPV